MLKEALREVESRLSVHRDSLIAITSKSDKDSALEFFGLRVPEIRREAREGFSFQGGPHESELRCWDYVWTRSGVFEVMCVPLARYDRIGFGLAIDDWYTLRGWIRRVENWAHADWLGGIYSKFAHASVDLVYPDLLSWSTSSSVWFMRTSLVSLIHYTGKNAAYLSPDLVFPVVRNTFPERCPRVARARSWVLREMHRRYPTEVADFLNDQPRYFTVGERRRALSTEVIG